MRNFPFLLTLVFTGILAQAQPKWVQKKSNGQLLIQSYSFVDSVHAYGTDGYGKLYKSDNSWETWEEIELVLNPDQEVVHLQMTSKTHGILISRTKSLLDNQRCEVYITTNGGYRWEQVFETQAPTAANQSQLYYEDVFVEQYKDKLYALYGDVFLHGKLNGEDWKEVRYPYTRSRSNDFFQVINDTVWVFEFGITTRITESAGESPIWSYVSKYVAYPQTFTLGNQIQKMGEYWLDQYNPKTGSWDLLTIKGDVVFTEGFQLSERFLLAEWHDFNTFDKHYSVYDYKLDAWTDLPFGNLFTEIEYWQPRGNSGTFVATMPNSYELRQTSDFGTTWEPVGETNFQYGNAFNCDRINMKGRLGFAFTEHTSLPSMYQTTDSGETWKFVDQIPGRTQVNYDPNSDLILFNGGKAFRPIWDADSIRMENVPFDSDIAGSVPVDITLMNGKGYALSIDNSQAYPSKLNSDGSWTSLAGINRAGNGTFRVVQNQKYALFIVNRIAYVYEKQNDVGYVLCDTLFNDAVDIAFLKSDVALLSTINAKYVCDLSNRSFEESWYSFESAFGVESMAVDTTGLIKVSTRGKLYNSRDFINFEVDTVGGFDYGGKVKFVNGHFWLTGSYNIYRLEDGEDMPSNEVTFEAIYPNPVIDKLYFCMKAEMESNFSISIYDELGRLVLTSDHSISDGISELNLNLSALRSGLYFLTIESPGARRVHKLIKL